MWKYYKDNDNNVYAFCADGSQDDFIKPSLIQITESDADELRKPPPLTIDQQIAEIKARLTAIDMESVRPLRSVAAGDATQYDTDKLAALASEASALREELATLTAELAS